MVYGFVKQSKGHVQISSSLGEGTRIQLMLPALAGDIPAPSMASGSDEVPRARGRQETILVVEDDVGVREYVTGVLADLNYNMLEAGDGPSGLEGAGAFRRCAYRLCHPNVLLVETTEPGDRRDTADGPHSSFCSFMLWRG
jgi:hypothetical protein